MASSVYVAAVEGFTGKSTLALGVLEELSKRVERVAVFRPVVREQGAVDYVLDLLVSRDAVALSYDECAGVTYSELHRDPDAALGRIVERYHHVAEKADAVVVVGSDYTDVEDPTEFSFNARVAANLGTPVMLVLNAHGKGPEALQAAAEVAAAELKANLGSLFAVVANRADRSGREEVLEALRGFGVPAFALPDEPLLNAPSVGDMMRACDGRLVSGDELLLAQEATGLVIAAMTLPNVLDRLFDGAVVVAPGDRPEVVLGVLNAQVSANFPQMSGIILNGGIPLAPQVGRLIEGLRTTMPIIESEFGTKDTAAALTTLRGRLHKDSPRKVATALALFDEYVDGGALLDRLDVARSDAVTPLMFEHHLLDLAVADRRHIVLPEGEDDRVLRAADIVLRRRIADLTVLGDPGSVLARAAMLGVDLSGAHLLSPFDGELRERFAAEYHERRRHKGVDLERARDAVVDVSYFGTMMVELGLADGMVSGAAHTTAHTIRPALEVVRTVPDVSVVSSVFFMCLRHQVLVYGDCAVNPDPTAPQLADIALASARTAAAFGVAPRVAMLSYSTGSSGSGSDVDKVVEATAMVRARAPDLPIEGPIQYDAAIDATVARTKLPDSRVAGRATVFVFPDLNTGNNTYKAVQRSAGALAVGPILQGLRKPVNDLSRGATVRDIVNTIAITAIQAQGALVSSQVLVLNAGSSSLKYSLVDAETGAAPATGSVERLGETGGELRHSTADGKHVSGHDCRTVGDALAAVQEAFATHGPSLQDAEIAAVGHRVVHGGSRFAEPAVVDDALLEELRLLVPLAPLHNPANLEGLQVARTLFPGVPQVAVFDTAFHQTMPPVAYTYAVPLAWREEHRIRRYGFHGTSYAFVSREAARLLGKPLDETNLIVLHLGNGASAAAIRGGRSVDTSMGFTPLEGLVMGTRSGDLDPAVHAHLHRELGWSIEAVDNALNRESGLMGLTGHNDFREVLALRSQGDEAARLGFDVYAYRVRKYVGAYAAVLGSVDAVVFTGGVGQHSPELRATSLAGLELLGVEIDPARNTASLQGPRAVSRDTSRVQVLVVPTDEEWEIARQAVAVTARQ